MGQLSRFKDLEIDWDMEPVDAVGLYLEWGNTGYGGSYENRVRSKDDESIYWVVYNWDETPKVFLVRRNSDGAEDLACLDLPDQLIREFKREMGDLKGTFPITDSIRAWLKTQINQAIHNRETSSNHALWGRTRGPAPFFVPESCWSHSRGRPKHLQNPDERVVWVH